MSPWLWWFINIRIYKTRLHPQGRVAPLGTLCRAIPNHLWCRWSTVLSRWNVIPFSSEESRKRCSDFHFIEFPFYREWNCKVFQISIFGQCPNFLQNETPWHTKTVLGSFHSTPNFSLLQNVLSKQNELSETCLSSCFVSTTPHKEQFTGWGKRSKTKDDGAMAVNA